MKHDNNKDKIKPLAYVQWKGKQESRQDFLDRMEAFGVDNTGKWSMKSYHRKWYVRAWRQFKFWLSQVW